MSKKRLFQILDDMNQEDIKNETRTIEVSSNFISADKIKQGGKIVMGIPEHSIHDLLNDNKIPVLLMVDKKEYKKRIH